MGRARQSGFTLIEAVIVIVITGIIASMVTVFIARPVQGYFDSARRADMTDTANTALRRISRDLRLALPNSVRVTTGGGSFYLEFLLTRAGGRYLQNDPCFTATCNRLDTDPYVVNGANIAVGSDLVAIYNIYNNDLNDCSPANPSAYCGQNTAIITGVQDNVNLGFGVEDALLFAPTAFPGTSHPDQRFQVIENAVTYVCTPAVSGGDGAGILTRYWGYAIAPAQPTVFAGGTGNALLATQVSGCAINYEQGVSRSAGLITMELELMQNNERVSLFHQVQINNVP